jgi:hypothetical protein
VDAVARCPAAEVRQPTPTTSTAGASETGGG